MEETNAALVARARRGDGSALELLVRRHLRAACAVALAIVGARADAEDVAQDAFLVAFERLDTCDAPERFAGWLLQIVRNQALNTIARRRVRGDGAELHAVEADGVVEPADPDRPGLRRRLLGALEQLTQAQREVVLLHDLEGWTHREIAEALDLSEVMSRQHLFNARRAMRARLTEDIPMEALHVR